MRRITVSKVHIVAAVEAYLRALSMIEDNEDVEYVTQDNLDAYTVAVHTVKDTK